MGSVIKQTSSFKLPNNKTRIIFFSLYFMLLIGYIVYGFLQFDETFAKETFSLEIPTVNLETKVVESIPHNGEFSVPDNIPGKYDSSKNTTFIFGHSSTIFKNLKKVSLGDTIKYQKETYIVNDITELKKESINMDKLLQSSEQPTLILMTCSGKVISGQDFTHRIIITAVKQ